MQAQPRNTTHIYYDVVMPNGYAAPNYPTVDASEQDNRNTPILSDPNQYELSILRLSIPGGAIPLKIMEMFYDPLSPGSINNTIYTLQLQGPSNTSTLIRLQWVTEDLFAGFPSVLTPGQTVYPDYADYYSMRSLQTWCNMVNTALATAFSQLVGVVNPTDPPFMVFDGATELFTLYIRASQVAQVRFFFNTPLKNIFGSTMRFLRLAMPIGIVGYELKVDVTGDNQRIPSGKLVAYNYVTQNYSNVNTTDMMSLTQIFVTSDMATRLQLEPGYINQSSNQQRNILTNFGVTNGNVRQDIQYVPSAEYRRMEILNSAPLYSAAMAVFWEDTLGNLYPIQVPAGKSVNLLLLFERR